MKIILTGAQGTGKTTILNHYKEEGYPVITEVVRNLAKQGFNINESGDKDGQNAIFNEYCKLFTDNKSFISDRGLTDVVAYTMYLCDTGRVTPKFMEEQAEKLEKFVKDNKDIVYFYFPIEFPVVNDGVRSVDEEFRSCIDINICTLLREMNIPFITVSGSVEERAKTIDYTLSSLNNGVKLEDMDACPIGG